MCVARINGEPECDRKDWCTPPCGRHGSDTTRFVQFEPPDLLYILEVQGHRSVLFHFFYFFYSNRTDLSRLQTVQYIDCLTWPVLTDYFIFLLTVVNKRSVDPASQP